MDGLTFQQGAIVGGRYRLEDKLGEGGMGAVWRAQHVTLKSPVAIKFINPMLATSQSALSRFMLEAQSSAALRSTHIVQVFDFGVEDGVPYIAMELLHGMSLGARLERDRVLSAAETSRVMLEVARAMDHAHGAGIVHRDLKPDNIFLVEEGNTRITKVLDFGIAKVTGGTFEATTGGGTKTGAVLGTPFYVSPEQARGNKQVDHRSDIWALGVITYECMLGTPPFVSDGLGDLIMKICGDPHPVPSSQGHVPPGFDQWCAKALAKNPEDRFQAALPMFEELAAIVAGRGFAQTAMAPAPTATVSAATAGASTTGGFSATHAGVDIPKRSAAPALAVLGGLVLLGGAGIGGWFALREPAQEVELAASAEPALGSAPSVVPAPLPEPAPVASEPPVPEPPASAERKSDAEEASEPFVAAPKPAPKPASRPKPRSAKPKPRPTPAAAKPAPAPKPAAPAQNGADLFDDRR